MSRLSYEHNVFPSVCNVGRLWYHSATKSGNFWHMIGHAGVLATSTPKQTGIVICADLENVGLQLHFGGSPHCLRLTTCMSHFLSITAELLPIAFRDGICFIFLYVCGWLEKADWGNGQGNLYLISNIIIIIIISSSSSCSSWINWA